MNIIIARINQFFEKVITADKLFSFFSFFIAIGIVLLAFKILRKIVMPVAKQKCTVQVQHIIGKGLRYLEITVIVMTVFNRLGINFTALLGAAGIVGVAVGFAAQTSVSNVISGVFVMTERAFKIDDLLQVDSIIGTVESIDLLSIRLRTPENQLVRIPNETIIKTNLINITHFPCRRFTMRVAVSYGTDLHKVKELLLDVASKSEFAESDPAPVIIFDSFADSSISVLFGVWVKNEQFLDLKNQMMVEVSERFAAEGIVIPFPQVDVHMSGA